MTDLSHAPNWNAMSDHALNKAIGTFIKEHRLNQNKTQQEVASAAGISRSTLSLLENGKTVTLTTFLQVLRVLDLLYIMDNFLIKKQISPIALAKLEKAKRKRASSTKETDTTESDW
ncbi:helix-turn-helix domain-containing protein [Aequorivita marina]|uniref:helix-turn-helix domain-containing protein n=1 Tax=Aequorivita marina TaxID=3073654 RepID=UPI002874856D|nr:helix-turn-helix transcriptional regulator [Aequorivita sp. S2608]MDS1299186.1 helix-turn-helix transcriptional regulator [Aequorivita sp. S2608]